MFNKKNNTRKRDGLIFKTIFKRETTKWIPRRNEISFPPGEKKEGKEKKKIRESMNKRLAGE